ncbi:MAG: HNH endonuclease [Gemmatimonadota bacterium]
MKRSEIFARDGYRCVYCGGVFEATDLSIDHVQPKVRGGDGSGGNVVTACSPCNTAKASRSLPQFLLELPEARRNFFHLARYVWPRHLIAVAEELARRGVVDAPSDFVEGVRRLRSPEAIASFMQQHDRWQHDAKQDSKHHSRTEGE